MSRNPIIWFVNSARNKGFIQTAQIAANVIIDLHFDWIHGTDTARFVRREDFGIQSSHLFYSHNYRVTKARPLLKLLRRLDLPTDCTFVDVGAGKGRVLLIASRYGFRRSTGIEFSGKLCEIAQKNVRIFTQKRKIRPGSVEVIEADATTYDFGPDERVLFLFNPFERPVMEEFVENLRRSLEKHPRKLWLIYGIPVCKEVISDSGMFSHQASFSFGGIQFQVYWNTTPSPCSAAGGSTTMPPG